MDIVAQIISERPGEPEKREFAISDLQSALSSPDKVSRKHVTLYPGDYASFWNNGTEVNIPPNVTVTLMPGAVVDYEDGYRIEDFKVSDGQTYDGPPVSEISHPLNTNRDGDVAKRYLNPNFTGNIENITDLNLASEWAFKQEFERSLWFVKSKQKENEEGNRILQSLEVPFRGTVRYTGGNKILVNSKEIEGEDDGVELTFNHIEYRDNEERDKENNPFLNSETPKVIQTLNVNDGHVLSAETLDLENGIKNKDGYITFGSNDNGKLVIGHAETGFADESGNPIPIPSIPDTQADSNLVAGEEYSVGIRTLETDDRGHVENIEYAPNVEEVREGRGINVVDLEPGNVGIREISLDVGGFQTGENVSITDSGDAIDISLTDSIQKTGLNSDPADPEEGNAVTWLSDGTGSGDTGDYMIKVNVGGTVKTGTLFDYSAA